MHTTYTPVRGQLARVRSHRANSNSYAFFNLLTSDALLDPVEALAPSTFRERLYHPTETLSLFLAQAMSADRSCQQIVNQAAVQRVATGLSPCSTRTGAYCRARQRLPMEMLAGLTRHVGAHLDAQAASSWRWQGRRIRIIDGTTLSMPDTPENQAVFPKQERHQDGLGFPICRVVGVTCLATGALIDAAVGPIKGKGSGENALLRSLFDVFAAGDIVMGDAYFATYFFVTTLQAQGVDFLMAQHGSRKLSTDFSKGQPLGNKDHLIVLEKPRRRPEWMSEADYVAAPNQVTVRELEVGGKILMTSLLAPTKNELKCLYQQRWQIEVNLRDIKETQGLGILSCKTPEMALKEIWVYLLAYNLIRLVMLNSASLLDITPRSLSFKHCLQIWRAYSRQACGIDQEMYGELMKLIGQRRVGNRPGRIEPRAVKRRPKPHPLLTKPRWVAQLEVRMFGHPKRLK